MEKFLIERDIPGAGNLTGNELSSIAATSNKILAGMAPRAQWLHSYVTDDRIFCVYVAEDEDAVREHARCGGFPANRVNTVRGIIDPTTEKEAM